ncbi:MAG: cyclic nucleotide-binding domain-containing protein [Rhodospirillales bacterium]
MSQFVERTTYQAGDFIFKEGDQANSAYIVQSGSVEILRRVDDEFQALAEIPEGGIFGEMALIDDAPRSAAARMKKGGTLVVVNRGTFEAKLKKTDPFIRTLLRIFVETIRRQQGS